jgi:hypothetical protein
MMIEIKSKIEIKRRGREEESKNEKSLPDLAARQGLNGGWEFATLSFPRQH